MPDRVRMVTMACGWALRCAGFCQPADDAGNASAIAAICCPVCVHAGGVVCYNSHLSPCLRPLNHGGLRGMRKLILRGACKANRDSGCERSSRATAVGNAALPLLPRGASHATGYRV